MIKTDISETGDVTKRVMEVTALSRHTHLNGSAYIIDSLPKAKNSPTKKKQIPKICQKLKKTQKEFKISAKSQMFFQISLTNTRQKSAKELTNICLKSDKLWQNRNSDPRVARS